MFKSNNKLLPLARELRKNMTEAEKKLWSKLSNRQMDDRQFYRKRVIGDYIVDFYCPRSKLVVEIDGGKRYLGKSEKDIRERDSRFSELGLTVLRFPRNEVLNELDGVLEQIYLALSNKN